MFINVYYKVDGLEERCRCLVVEGGVPQQPADLGVAIVLRGPTTHSRHLSTVSVDVRHPDNISSQSFTSVTGISTCWQVRRDVTPVAMTTDRR